MTACFCGSGVCCSHVSDTRNLVYLTQYQSRAGLGLTPLPALFLFPLQIPSSSHMVVDKMTLSNDCCLVSHEPMCMQARFLLAKLNPSATHQSNQGLTNEIIFTEDVSLNVSTEQHHSLCLFCCVQSKAVYMSALCNVADMHG